MLANEINIGDIVTLNSHPFFQSVQAVIISGESQLLPPLMVVLEFLKETKDQYDEKTGDEQTKKGNAQCKCMWYSHKTHQFEEAWLTSKSLKLIKANPISLTKNDLFQESTSFKSVSLKTIDLEMGKLKSSLSKDENNQTIINEPKSIINPLLSFVSPIMEILQVTEVKDSDKEPQYDTKTGKQKRYFSKWSVKCKWFNPSGDKFSEKFLPIDALQVIEAVNEEALKELNKAIDSDQFILIDKAVTNSVKQSIIKPLSIVFRSGQYYLIGYDYCLNKKLEIKIPFQPTIVEEYFHDSAPSFTYLREANTTKSVTDEIKECIEKGLQEQCILRVKYMNKADRVTYKTMTNYSVLSAKETEKDIFYLTGQSISHKEERTLRLDRILSIQTLNLKFEKKEEE